MCIFKNKSKNFTYDNVPTHFKTVSELSIQRLRGKTLASIERKYKGEFEPAALKSMLQSVADSFNYPYKKLSGDYNGYRNELDKAYEAGKADIHAQIMDLEKAIEEQKLLFERYDESQTRIFGRSLSKDQKFDKDITEKMKKKYSELK